MKETITNNDQTHIQESGNFLIYKYFLKNNSSLQKFDYESLLKNMNKKYKIKKQNIVRT